MFEPPLRFGSSGGTPRLEGLTEPLRNLGRCPEHCLLEPRATRAMPPLTFSALLGMSTGLPALTTIKVSDSWARSCPNLD